MAYNSIIDLLKDAQIDFPKHAREIYKQAYDKAWDEYGDTENRQGSQSRKEAAHRLAWKAVENKYEKGPGGKWRKKS